LRWQLGQTWCGLGKEDGKVGCPLCKIKKGDYDFMKQVGGQATGELNRRCVRDAERRPAKTKSSQTKCGSLQDNGPRP
jgi:hypothetical protein